CASKQPDDMLRVHTRGLELLDIGYFQAGNVLHDDGLLAAQSVVDMGHIDLSPAGEVLAKRLGVVGLLGIVHLFEDGSFEFGERSFPVHAPDQIRKSGQYAGHAPKHRYVESDLFLEVGALHFYHHGLAGFQAGAMYLTEAGRSDGDIVEALEEILDSDTGFGFDYCACDRRWERRHLVLQLG